MTMLKINSQYAFSVSLINTYKSNYLLNRRDITSLHQYILAHIYTAKFADEAGKVNDEAMNELYNSLALVTDSTLAEPYEALFFWEINRALGKSEVNDQWLIEYPQYREHCKLSTMSLDFLCHIGLYASAEIVCNELFYSYRFTYNDYIAKMTDILCKQNKYNEAFDYLVGIIKETSGFVPASIFGKAYSLCWKLDRSDEMLEVYRWCVANQPHLKWISSNYITLCLAKDLKEEAQAEYDRFIGIVLFLYKDGIINKQNAGVFKMLLSIRKEMGMECSADAVAAELGFTIEEATAQPKTPKAENSGGMPNNAPWENDFNHKALLKRVTKMNKQFRTYTKLFLGGERELTHAKSILGSYLAIVYNRFYKLFGKHQFDVTDFNAFYLEFPFYELNGITEEEIVSVASLLNKLHAVTVQLNPFVTSRSFPLEPIVADILSVNTELELGNKKFSYVVVEESSGQITVFGAILLIATFLTDDEKIALAFDLAGSEPKLSEPFIKQVLSTIPSAKDADNDELGMAELANEKNIFSLYIRKEIFRFLMELEAAVLQKHNLIEADRPNMNAKTFNQMLSLEFVEGTTEYIGLSELHTIAKMGLLVGEQYGQSVFSVERLVNTMFDCVSNGLYCDIIQSSIDTLFTISVNRKYYNLLKWQSMKSNDNFLKRIGIFCQKMMYRNDSLLTESDEYALYDCAKEHLFTYIDDFQRNEFSSVFGGKVIEWKKLDYTVYHVDSSKFTYLLNGNKGTEEYLMLRDIDDLEVSRMIGTAKVMWRTIKVFDSPIAHCEIKEAY